MTHQDECPECATNARVLALYLLFCGVLAVGIALSPKDENATQVRKVCDDIRRLSGDGHQTMYDATSDTCSVWTGMEWRPVIIDAKHDKR